jgi:acetate kinase
MSGAIERIGEEGSETVDHEQAIARVVADVTQDTDISVVGHRVVHGGERFHSPTVIDDHVIDELVEVSSLAPLHNPPNIQGIRAAMTALPEAVHVAVFDTAFFHTLPPEATTYALPAEIRRRFGIRKYGFHGTSHEYVSGELARLDGGSATRVITCHLGNGSSMAAIESGVAVDTSMGFTPLPGLVMGTRSGDIDPAIVLHLLREGMSVDEVDNALTRSGGMVGLTGFSDMRDVISRAEAGDPDCELALSVWAGRIRHFVGAFWAVMGGVDALVFTGGIGENSPVLRERIVSTLARVGFDIDLVANLEPSDQARIISTASSPTSIWVIPTDEELQIARHSHLLHISSR